MKKCNTCGMLVDDNIFSCPRCNNSNFISEQLSNENIISSGFPQETLNQSLGKQIIQQQDIKEEKGNIIWLIVGFLIPIVGIVLYFVWKESKVNSAKMALKGAITSMVLTLIWFIIYFLILALQH